MNQRMPPGLIRAVLIRAALFAGTWVLLVGTDPLAWIIGAPAVVAATLVHLRLAQDANTLTSARVGSRLSARELLRFVPFFLWESLRGGLDVAGRVLVPRMRVAPGMHDYLTRLRGHAARVMFVDTISVLPGTLSADLRGDRVTIHALDVTAPLDPELRRLEDQVARLFGEGTDPSSRDGSARVAGNTEAVP
jgi:multicomponent Na+:H+ antiporter subunit E